MRAKYSKSKVEEGNRHRTIFKIPTALATLFSIAWMWDWKFSLLSIFTPRYLDESQQANVQLLYKIFNFSSFIFSFGGHKSIWIFLDLFAIC